MIEKGTFTFCEVNVPSVESDRSVNCGSHPKTRYSPASRTGEIACHIV